MIAREEGTMSVARVMLGLGALLLFVTAAFHASGAAMVQGWLPGSRGRILELLWVIPTVDWAIVGLLWAAIAWFDDSRLRLLVWISAVIPVMIAILLIKAVGFGHPGIWLLIGAAVLAIVGSLRLGRGRPASG